MAAATTGDADPPGCEVIIRYMLSVPLDFDPGAKSTYSNFGYCVLGRIIEKIASAAAKKPTSYESHIKSSLLAPIGITKMRIGGTRLSERLPGEVRYYPSAGQPLAPSVYPGEGYVPFAYGGFYVRASQASGGWVGSAEDLVRFAIAIDGQRAPALLTPQSFRKMLFTPVPSSPADPRSSPSPKQTGLSWTVVPRDSGVDFWHTGGLIGSNAAWLVRTSQGITLAFTFNSLPAQYTEFFGSALPKLLDKLNTVPSWPETDLFKHR